MKEYKYKINGNLYKVIINNIKDNIASIEVNGTLYEVELEQKKKTTHSSVQRTQLTPKKLIERPLVNKPESKTTQKSAVQAPLPGTIVDIIAKVGDNVKRGDTIVVLEAMKMENNICAHKDGSIVEIKVDKNETVLEGTDLVIIE